MFAWLVGCIGNALQPGSGGHFSVVDADDRATCMSSTPAYEVKSLAIGLAEGIIVDASVIRALLVPALMKVLGDANWWGPGWAAIVPRVPQREPAPEVAPATSAV